MCLNPTTLPNGQLVACRICNICVENAAWDWVGRCLAETRTSVATHSVTLTYGRDKDGIDRHERATVLTYSDVQIWLKRLRNNGYPCRYLIAGEYGTLKGRAHWHGIIFWQKTVPPIKLYQRYWDDMWTHGHMVWKKPEPSHVKYCCKYIRKDAKDKNAQSKFTFSKNPHIGGEYFEQKARQMVKEGLVPRDAFYTFPEARMKKTGRLRKFFLKDTARDKFMEAWCRAYQERHPGKHFPESEFLWAWLDKNSGWVPSVDVWPRKPVDLDVVNEWHEDPEKVAFRQEHYEWHFGGDMVGWDLPDWQPPTNEGFPGDE